MQTAFIANPIHQALISVSDKTGIIPFASDLAEFGIRILSTGGTAKLIRDAGIAVEDVSAYTKFPEMMDGRVKTLHPLIHGGLLGRVGIDDEVMEAHGIRRIGFIAVNLYQFAKTVAKPGCTLEEAIEQIDIGGPAMLRSAAKNYAWVTVVVDPTDYSLVMEEMRKNNGVVSVETRFALAKKVFAHTAAYDTAISAYLYDKGAVHGLRYGFSLCNFSLLPLKEWPKGHTGVRFNERDLITCPNCQIIAEHIERMEQ